MEGPDRRRPPGLQRCHRHLGPDDGGFYGVDYLKKLEKNKPQIGRSSMDPVTLMNGSERAMRVAIPSATTLLSMSRGNPLKLILSDRRRHRGNPGADRHHRELPASNAAKL